MVIFDSAAIFIRSSTSLHDKIAKIDLVIEALLDNALEQATKDNIKEYSLNDGQTIIRTEYNNSMQVEKSIQAFERLRQIYVNGINGRMIRLIDGKSFDNGRHGRF